MYSLIALMCFFCKGLMVLMSGAFAFSATYLIQWTSCLSWDIAIDQAGWGWVALPLLVGVAMAYGVFQDMFEPAEI